MALQTANQFNLTPNATGAFSQGVDQGAKLKNQFITEPKLQQLTKSAAGGDKQALIDLQAMSPERANQFQQFKGNEQSLQSGAQDMERKKLEDRTRSVINGALEVQQIKDPKSKLMALKKRKIQLMDSGTDTQDTDEAIALYETGDIEGGNELIDNVVELGIRNGVIKRDPSKSQSAEGASFENLIANFSDKDKVKARRVKAGLDPRMVGSASQTIADLGSAATVADVESVVADAKETGKLTAQFKLKPKVEAAVLSAAGKAKADLKATAENKSNSKTLGIYDTAMGNLTTALDNTITAPFVGLTPALTSNAQIADGATAMMLPLMKDVFRSAGEGTFTEGDQKILTNLIPTRSDNAEARASKISMIDSMIRAKLSTPSEGEGELSAAEQKELSDLKAELGL